MAKQATNAATTTRTNGAAFSSLKAFGAELRKQAKAEQSAAARVLGVVVKARGGFDIESKAGEKAMRETLLGVFEQAGTPSPKKRTSDAMAVLKADSLPDDLPGNLQRAADAVRANRPDSQKRGPQNQPSQKGSKASKATKADDAPMTAAAIRESLQGTVQGLRKRAADDDAAALLDMVADILNDAPEDEGVSH